MAKSTSPQIKTAQVNTFTGGINTDLHPLIQPNDTLTDCVNGTLITYNGNENMLQNDMGNYELKGAKLPAGYIPLGMKEHQGILYIASMNPITNKIQLGSYPSPQVSFGNVDEGESYNLNSVEIGTKSDFDEFVSLYKTHISDYSADSDGSSEESFFVWQLIDFDSDNFPEVSEEAKSKIKEIQRKLVYTKLDLSKSSTLFTKDFSKNTMLTCGDKYKLNIDESNLSLFTQAPFQTFEYFTLDDNKNVTIINKDDVYYTSDLEFLENSEDSFNDAVWKSNGWLGARFTLDEIPQLKQSVRSSGYFNNKNIFVSEYSKPTNVSVLSENQSFEYKFKIDGLDTQNRIINFEDYIKEHDNDLVVVSGILPFDGNPVEILDNDVYFGVKTPVNNAHYRLFGNYTKNITAVVANELYNFNGVVDTSKPTYYICKELDVSKIEYNMSIELVEINGNPINIVGIADLVNCKIHCPENKLEYYKEKIKQHVTQPNINFVEYTHNHDAIIREEMDDFYYKLLSPKDKVTDYTVGLNGSFEDGVYKLQETDNEDALLELIDSSKNCTLLLPATKKFASISGGQNNTLIIPYELSDEEELCISDTNSEYPQIYTNIPKDRIKIGDTPQLTTYPSDAIHSIQNFQFKNFKIGYINTPSDIFANNIVSIKLIEDNGIFLSLLINNEGVDPNQGFGEDVYENEFIGDCALAYAYLFSDFRLEGSISTWVKKGGGIVKEIICVLNAEDNYCHSIIHSNPTKWVVPVSFCGKIDGNTISESEYKWTSYERIFLYTLSSKQKTSWTDISVLLKDDIGCDVLTKISNSTGNNNITTYHNLSSGYIQHSYENLENNSFTVTSVPKKVSGNKMLIYDNMICEDILNISSKEEKVIVGYDYYTDQNILYVNIETSHAVLCPDVSNSAKIYVCSNNSFVKQECTISLIGTTTVSDVVQLKIEGIQAMSSHDFVFISIYLDSNNTKVLPINTHVTKDHRDTFIAKGIHDFTKIYADQFPTISNSNIENSEDIEEEHKYITAKINEDNELELIHESDMPYYWYNGLPIDNSTSETTGTYYFGEAKRVKTKINLTALGISEGVVIDISGPGMYYKNIVVSAKNSELFLKDGSTVYLIVDTIGEYTIYPYDISLGGDIPILNRQYLIKHNGPPVTHNDSDLEWTNTPIYKYAGWEDDVAQYKMLSVTKADACNSNVHVGSTSLDEYIEDKETFTQGPVLTNKSQINAAISKVVGEDTCKQLFTLIDAKITVDKSGLTIPIPRMDKGYYQYQIDGGKTKKNKGTERAIVVTRESGGGWSRASNVIHKFIAYSGIVGGIAAVAGCVVAGCIAAGSAAAAATTAIAATASAALACIPFVGWAILAAAVLAASIVLLTKVTAGKDQQFQFYTIRGSKQTPLIIPLWGAHLSCKSNGEESNNELKHWQDKDNKRYPEGHPWYLNPHYTKGEELITYILTHVFYQKEIGKGKIEKSTLGPRISDNMSITIKTKSPDSLMSILEKYSFIQSRISESNNFKIQNTTVGESFIVSATKNHSIGNVCWGSDENHPSFKNESKYEETYIVDNNISKNEYFDQNVYNDIYKELCSFVKYLKGSGKNVYYDGPIHLSEQEAFGGNTGGRWSRFRCWAYPNTLKKMVSGEYPRNDLEYTPIAYSVSESSDDKCMVKDLGWGDLNSWWGKSKTTYIAGTCEEEAHEEYGSKYLDYIKWNSYSEEFKLTCNTNDI